MGLWEFAYYVMVDLLNDTSIARGYLLLDTTQKIWDVVALTYSQTGNDAQVYELRKKVHETQAEMTIAHYFLNSVGYGKNVTTIKTFKHPVQLMQQSSIN